MSSPTTPYSPLKPIAPHRPPPGSSSSLLHYNHSAIFDPSITGIHRTEEMEEKEKCQQNSKIDQFLALEQCYITLPLQPHRLGQELHKRRRRRARFRKQIHELHRADFLARELHSTDEILALEIFDH